jgi:predicted mannosyl-3-phosphoglycerate phosphatase (HAD superfamily)
MRLGREATPVLANFEAIGLPVGGKGSKTIMEMLFLNDDVDAEI